MGAMKNLDIFCKNNGLDPKHPRTMEFFRRDEKGLPWGEEEGGAECPECGKHCAKVNGAKWYCFYCGKGGTIEGKAAVRLTPEQQRAERELQKEQEAVRRTRALASGISANQSEATGQSLTI